MAEGGVGGVVELGRRQETDGVERVFEGGGISDALAGGRGCGGEHGGLGEVD